MWSTIYDSKMHSAFVLKSVYQTSHFRAICFTAVFLDFDEDLKLGHIDSVYRR